VIFRPGILFSVAVLLVSATCCQADDRGAAARHWENAEKYLAKGWKGHALEEAKVVLRLDPRHEGALSLVGSRGMWVDVPAAVSGAGLVSATPANLSSEAVRAYRESRVDDARRFAGEILAASPGDPEAAGILASLDSEVYQPSPLGSNDVIKDLFDQGIALWRREKWGEAAGIFQQALALEVSHEQVRSFHDRARKHADSDKVVREMAVVREALAAGRTADAGKALERVLAMDPGNAEALALQESMGAGPLAMAKRAQAKKHFNRGVDLYGRGKWAESAREWELVVALDPGDQEAKSLLRKAQGKTRAAKKDSGRRIVSLHEEALKLYQQGKADEARKIYTAILDLDPDDARAKSSLSLMDGAK